MERLLIIKWMATSKSLILDWGNVAANPVFCRTVLITRAMRLFHCDSEIVTAVSGYSIVFMKDD
jgi:hypothetical protein